MIFASNSKNFFTYFLSYNDVKFEYALENFYIFFLTVVVISTLQKGCLPL